MKKFCLLLVLALLLSGCGQKPLPTETTATEESTAPSETTGEIPTTEPVTVDHSYRGEDWESGYVITEDWGFFCPHMDTDVYRPYQLTFDLQNITLLSREPINPESISAVLETDVPYEVFVQEMDWYYEDEDTIRSSFFQYIYASYQNWDWKKHKEMNQEFATIEESLEKAAYDAEYHDVLGQEYEHAIQTGEGMPKFYAYLIMITLDYNAVEEDTTLRYMDVSWPGVSFRHEFGELRLHAGFPEEFDGFPCEMAGIGHSQFMHQMNRSDFEYIGEQQSGMLGEFVTSEELVLLRGYALDGCGEINDVRLVFQTDEGVVDMEWDENSKVWLDPGTRVEVWVKAGGPETFWSVNNERLYYGIEYECNGVRDAFAVSSHMDRVGNPYVLWALYFDETNLRSYYDDYWWAD